jgi:DNA-binding response OmpR family regulator
MRVKQILVVDDEPHLIRSLTFILSKEGFEIATAVDGEEVLKKVSERKPDLIFLDIMLPKKNGYEVCTQIKQTPELQSIYIIMLSAKGGAIVKENALKAGANEFISKPFNLHEVVNRVKQILGSASGQDDALKL